MKCMMFFYIFLKLKVLFGVDDKFGSVEVSKDRQGRNIYRYVYKVYKNGIYRFKIVDINGLVNGSVDENVDKYVLEKTIVIDNIVSSQETINNYINGKFDPTPFLDYEYVSDSEIYITTQKFFLKELIDLQCFYSKDINKNDYGNNSFWTKVETRSFKDDLSGDEVYQFYFSVKNDDLKGNGVYTVKFYNIFLNKYTYSSINIDFEKILEKDGSILYRYVSFFKQRFGFLVYPIELFSNVFTKLNSVEFSDPRFNIPDIYEPFTRTRIISAVDFNFNSILNNNEVFKNIHNIYLILVDVIIIFALLNLAKKNVMEVFSR